MKKVYHGERRGAHRQRQEAGCSSSPTWASATCPSAWPRPSTPSPTTQTLLGAPRGFTVTVRNLKVSAGAGFIVALTGDIMTMPGLPKVPAAEKIDVDENGKITGLF